MASNLSTIGFIYADEEAFRTAMTRYAADTMLQADFPAGSYGIWRARAGAEIWFHFGKGDDGTTEIFGLTPFFEGQSDIQLKITGPISRDGDTPFEGAFTGWVNPGDDGEGRYPLVFDAVDFALNETSAWPAVRRVRLVGFARDVAAFGGEAAYYAARKTDNGSDSPAFAAQAFVPAGLFIAAELDASNGEAEGAFPSAPSSEALLTGRIVEHQHCTNEATGRPFVWLLVESLDATFDIVADPAVITGEIIDGGTIEAAVWLFGRFLD